MDLDWCSESDLKNTTIFNPDSIISFKSKKNEIINEDTVNKKNDIIVNDCFIQNLSCKNSSELLNILNYLSNVSNYLRTFIRNVKNNNFITDADFYMIVNYLNWIYTACKNIKSFFASPLRKDNSYDPNCIKPFKTSSYKFCTFKDSCCIHKHKNRTCDKNHFVFDMIINDITKLLDSLNLIQYENLNWILSNKFILIEYNVEEKIYKIIQKNNYEEINNEYQFLIDKSLIYKSFDVISYVLSKMYNESYSFLNFNIKSLQIIID
jgi:hypothetical protein